MIKTILTFTLSIYAIYIITIIFIALYKTVKENHKEFLKAGFKTLVYIITIGSIINLLQYSITL